MRKLLIFIGVFWGIIVVIIVLLWVTSLFQEPRTLQLPAITKWTPCPTKEYRISYNENSGLYMEGDNSELFYQLISPKKYVIPFRTYKFSLPIQVHQGNVAVGVLNCFQSKWLISPIVLKDEYIFHTKLNLCITFVIANYNTLSIEKLPSSFTVSTK